LHIDDLALPRDVVSTYESTLIVDPACPHLAMDTFSTLASASFSSTARDLCRRR
jgi:hypothetical protein